jgi:uncharacterized damage-inducible protein DinB
MVHPLVTQLRFARSELERCLEGLSGEDAIRRLPPMNAISWLVGHLADQENRYWLLLGQGRTLAPELRALVGYGRPATTPPLDEMLSTWQMIITAADPFLNTLTPARLETKFIWRERPLEETIGTMLQRNIYHYWYHIGEASAIRQMLGHPNVPEFVGDMKLAPYSPEA